MIQRRASQRDSMMPYRAYPIQDVLTRAARALPTKVAIIEGDRQFTYRQLDQCSSRFAAALATRGISKGDRVGILAPNCIEFEIAFFGIARAGGSGIPSVDHGLQQRLMNHHRRGAAIVDLMRYFPFLIAGVDGGGNR